MPSVLRTQRLGHSFSQYGSPPTARLMMRLITNDTDRGKTSMEACVRDIDLWMVHNRLKLNQDKTEVLVFSSCYRPRPNIGNLTIVDKMVNCSSTAKDIGVTLDNSLSMVPHITAVCKSAFFHLRNISKIRGFLNTETTKTLVHAFVTSKVDYCNSCCMAL